MRLSTEQVRAGVMHPDQEVHSEAVHYFVGEFSQDPAIMPLVIQAIETYGFANAFRAYYFLDSLVQIDETVRWLMAQIRGMAFQPAEETAAKLHPYILALIHAHPSVLKSFESKILDFDALTDQDRDAVTEQIWFPTRPTEELWDDLERLCSEHDGSNLFPDKQEVDFVDSGSFGGNSSKPCGCFCNCPKGLPCGEELRYFVDPWEDDPYYEPSTYAESQRSDSALAPSRPQNRFSLAATTTLEVTARLKALRVLCQRPDRRQSPALFEELRLGLRELRREFAAMLAPIVQALTPQKRRVQQFRQSLHFGLQLA